MTMSIRLRLTLLYSAVLAVTLVIFGMLLYFRLDHTLHSEVDQSLRDRAGREVRLAGDGNPRANPGGPGGSPSGGASSSPPRPVRIGELAASAALGDPNIYEQVIDSNGQVCFSAPANGTETLPRPTSTGQDHFETASANHVHLRMLVKPISGDIIFRNLPACSPPFAELLARSLSDVDTTLSRLRFVLLVGTAVSLIVAGGAGWLLARNALRPIDRLTAEAGDIGRRQDFKRRVEHHGPEDEVGRLAATFNNMLDGLDAAHEQLQRALEAQRRFVADASHELRTPLTTIRGNAELLRLEDSSVNPDHREALADIFTETERMSRLVNNLLALARADGGLHINRRPVEVQPVIAEVFQKESRLVEAVDLRLDETMHASVSADRDYLVQLLFILVDNAIKYTPPGGSVTITSRVENGTVLISVRDTGVGIAPRDQARVFDRFYRSDPSRHGEGTGLGLSIARWIAQELGGTIQLGSELGKGSTFTVLLPALSAMTSEHAQAVETAEAAAAGH